MLALWINQSQDLWLVNMRRKHLEFGICLQLYPALEALPFDASHEIEIWQRDASCVIDPNNNEQMACPTLFSQT